MTTPNSPRLLGEFLRREGFTVEAAHEGNRGLDRALQPGVDLVVLDVMLPGIDGFEILRRLRQKSKVPVLMLTARGEDVDRIVGLELGADDYLAKPFNPRELAARIRAILRRYEPRSAAPANRIEVNGIVARPRRARGLRRRQARRTDHLRIRHSRNADALRRPRALARRPDGEFL